MSGGRRSGLVDPARIGALLESDSVALVGASDRSAWSTTLYENWTTYGGGRPAYLVNPRRDTVHGQPAAAKVSDLSATPDLAVVMVGTDHVHAVVTDALEAGVRNFVILSSGFAESGPEGDHRQAELVEMVTSRGGLLVGPNSVGFLATDPTLRTPFATPIVHSPRSGALSIVLESGGLAGSVMNLTQAKALGIDVVFSVGNQAAIDTADIVGHLVLRPSTRSIALFLESVRRPVEFLDVARQALEAGKPIVALKVGRSEQGRRAALAHTGALTGDARVARAVLDDAGVVLVDSLEDLVATAGLLSNEPRRLGRRTAVVAASGGACELIADKGSAEGLEFPDFDDATTKNLAELLPDFAHPANPLDVTGYIVVDPMLQVKALETVISGADGRFDQIVVQTLAPKAQHSQQRTDDRYRAVSGLSKASPVPVIVQTASGFDLTGPPTWVSEELGLHFVDGIEHGIGALGRAARWWQRRQGRLERLERQKLASNLTPSRPATGVEIGPATTSEQFWGEVRSRAVLETAGVPLVPVVIAGNPCAAVKAATDFGGHVVLKVADDSVAHKSDIGGVRVGVCPHEVDVAASELFHVADVHRLRRALLVAPMREGIELMVSVVRDPDWGPILLLASGGVWVELLDDTAIAQLPVDAAGVRRMLESLRCWPQLAGARGRPPASVDAIADAVLGAAEVALRLGPRLATLEINPMIAGPQRCEVVDSLITWATEVT